MNIAYDSLLLGIFLLAAVFGLFLSIISYKRTRTKRMLIILSIFSIFTLKAVLLTVSLFWEPLGFLADTYYHTGFDIAIITVLIILGLRE